MAHRYQGVRLSCGLDRTEPLQVPVKAASTKYNNPVWATVAAFIFRCPNTGLNVQGWIADDPEAGEGFYEAVTCTACTAFHLVDPENGNVLGADPEK